MAERDPGAAEPPEPGAPRAASLLAATSHEIRTLLNGVTGMLGLVLDSELTHEQREYLQTAQSSSESLLTILGDLLDSSKLEAGRVTLEAIPFAPRELLEQSLRGLAPRGHGRALELVLDLERGAEPGVVGDPTRLRQVVANLVSNALKFTERGEVVVRAWRPAEEPERFYVEVRDTGVGIAPGRLGAVFEPFAQSDDTIARQYGGTGLGLTVSRQLVALMGGELSVQSTLGEGSTFTFWVRLPLAPDAMPTDSRLPVGMLGRTVLLVEDHAPTRAVLQRRLTDWGIVVVEADGPQQALDALYKSQRNHSSFALALVDNTLPEGGALALVEALQSVSIEPLPVVVMTAGQSIPAERLRAAQVLRSLAKPVSTRELLSTLCAITPPTSSSPSLISSFPPARMPSPSPLPANLVGPPLRVLLVEDNQVNARVAMRLVERDGHQVTLATDGALALSQLTFQPFDLVLMDIQMPVMDGLEATRALRERESLQGDLPMPVVVLTANAMSLDDERLTGLNVEQVLLKPLDPHRLRHVLASAKRRAL